MELIGLDASFQTVKVLRCVNIQWNRRYYEAGDFALQLCACDWDVSIAYIYLAVRPEMGMVQKVETQHDIKGDFVNVSGFFLEGMLNWKVAIPKHSSTGNVSAACKTLVATHMTDAGVTVPTQADIGTVAAFESEGEFLGDATYTVLKAQELSQRIRFDYDTDSLLYEVWQAKDRTQSQSTNAYATFSQNFGTVDDMTLTQDESAYRNYAIIGYISTATGNPTTRDVDLRSDPSEVKRILYIDTGMSIADGQTVVDFHAAVEAEGRKMLADYPLVVNIDATVLQTNLLYLIDYDIGDKCDVRDDRLQLAFESRIIEINEVWKANLHTVALQFGDKIPTIYERGRA